MPLSEERSRHEGRRGALRDTVPDFFKGFVYMSAKILACVILILTVFAAGAVTAEEKTDEKNSPSPSEERKTPPSPWETFVYIQASIADDAKIGFGGGGVQLSFTPPKTDSFSLVGWLERQKTEYKKGGLVESFNPAVLGLGMNVQEGFTLGIAYAADDGFRSASGLTLRNRWAVMVGLDDSIFNRGLRSPLRVGASVYFWNAAARMGAQKQTVQLTTIELYIGYAYRFGQQKEKSPHSP